MGGEARGVRGHALTRIRNGARQPMIGALRRFAQLVRHAPGLRNLDKLWSVLRRPYERVISSAANRTGVAVRVGDSKIMLHPDFANIGWETVERDSYLAFQRAIEPGAVVFDVGAHIGTYTILARQAAGPAGQVVAFEPDDTARRYFSLHMDWNGCTEGTLIREVCCGAGPGHVEFYHDPQEPSGQSGMLAVEGFSTRRVERPQLTWRWSG